MFYLYVMAYDASGEGVRATLLGFDNINDANKEFNATTGNEDTILVKLIKGEIVREYNADNLTVPSSDEVLQASPLQDVDDLENKEGV